MSGKPFEHGLRLDDALAKAKQGSAEAFTFIYREFAPEIASFVSARGIRDVDELVNDVFLGAFRNIGRFEGNGRAFRSYLFRIARNKISDSRTIDRREQGRTMPLEGLERAGPDDQVERLVLRQLDAQQLRSLLDRLTSDQRDVILLRFLVGLPIGDVSEVISKPASAVKALQRRGLDALRRIVSAEGGIEFGHRTDSWE